MVRRQGLGYSGWKEGSFPKLSAESLERLRTEGPDAFEDAHGAYFVSGSYNGASLIIHVTVSASKSEDKSSLAASLKASYSGAFSVSAEGGYE